MSGNVVVVTAHDKYYPRYFLGLPDMPEKLYCNGNLELLRDHKKRIAIIGTRNPTSKGLILARSIAERCIDHDYVVVAGLAYGIDKMVHIAATCNAGETIAVVLDVEKVYPSEHESLAESILACGGLLLSEHRPGKTFAPPGQRGSWAYETMHRDRLQSALSTAVIPVQTGYKQVNKRGQLSLCGTMHTVEYAKDQGRHIFVPEIPEGEPHDAYAGIQYLIDRKTKTFTLETMQKVVFDFLEKPLVF